jgi:hypothetical protein
MVSILNTARTDLVYSPCVFAKNAAYVDFVIKHEGDHEVLDPGSLTCGIDFQVFGRQDT